jgi:hypothetical protein
MPGRKGEARDVVGEKLGVSRSYVAAAKALKAKAPELFQAVERGECTVSGSPRAEARRKPAGASLPAPAACS